jgi:apolipoprotein N-acyltransferase
MSHTDPIAGIGQTQTSGPAGCVRKHPVWVPGVLAAGASGGLMAACYWPLHCHWLAWVALVPWLLVLPRLGPMAAWLCGMILAMVFYRLSLAWMFDLYPGPIAGGVVLGLSVLMGFAFGVARALMGRIGPSALLWAVPACFVAQEVIRSEGHPLYRFSQVAWGYSQAHNLWIVQLASLGGVHFVTFCVVAVNAALAYGLARRCWRGFAPFLCVAGAVLATAAVSQPSSYDALPQVAAACVQEESRSYDRYRELTAQAAADPSRPEFVVLPEHTITEFSRNDEKLPLVGPLERIAVQYGAYICVGAHTQPSTVFNLRDPSQRAEYLKQCYYDNTALLIGPEGRIVLKQLKMVPVPFYADGNPGLQQQVCATPHGKVGLYVCYDETFTDVMRRLDDAGLFLGPVLNNKDWPPQQRWQQADMIPFRCVELRRCIVRAASSGISQIIDAAGRVRSQRTQEDGPGILCGKVYFVTDRTLFSRGGYLFAIAVALAFLAAVAILTLLSWLSLARRAARRLFRRQRKCEA